MEGPIFETLRRDKIIADLLIDLKRISSGIILAGSMAYGHNKSVGVKSDIDIMIIVDDLKRLIPYFFTDSLIASALSKRFFEGYCLKKIVSGVEISYHIITKDAFDIITKCFVADIRVYRNAPKGGNYVLKCFDGNSYKYYIKNKPLPDLYGGVRTIVPIGFVKDDIYYMGVYRDKIICCSKILYDPVGDIKLGIEKLWENIVKNLIDESLRRNKSVDLSKMNILNALAKSKSLTNECRMKIHEKTTTIISSLTSV